jgi:glycine amidinotransferase
MTETILNSWNEWDPLRHVIVVRADNCHIPPEEPALDAKVPEDSDMRGQWGKLPQETIDRANELLDNFVGMLEKRGVRVDRPTSIDHPSPRRGPISIWKASSAVCRRAMCC